MKASAMIHKHRTRTAAPPLRLVKDNPGERALHFLELACGALDEKTAKKFITQALKADPECIDALRMKAEMTPMRLIHYIQDLRGIVDLAAQKLGPDFASKNAGRYWFLVETRPFMR